MRGATRKGRLMTAAAAIAVMAALQAPVPGRAFIAPFCTTPDLRTAAIGQGSVPQAAVHASLFIPAYNTACPAAIGKINFLGTSDQSVADFGAFWAARYRLNPFFGSDAPLTTLQKEQLELDTTTLRGQISLIHQIPIYVTGIDVGYNLGSCPLAGPLRLRRSVLAAIYTGAVSSFDDRLLVADNPGLATCHQVIKVSVLADASGTTTVFKDYLSGGNPAFVALKQPELNQQWPSTLAVRCRGTSEAGMATCLEEPGAIAYLQHRVAAERSIPAAALENASQQFASPAAPGERWPSGCQVAAGSAVTPPTTLGDWSQTSLTNTPSGYPICAFSYIWIFDRLRAAYASNIAIETATNTVDYITTIVGPSVQAGLVAAGLAPLPPSVLAVSRAGIGSVTF